VYLVKKPAVVEFVIAVCRMLSIEELRLPACLQYLTAGITCHLIPKIRGHLRESGGYEREHSEKEGYWSGS
jgi:hypothetical protein